MATIELIKKRVGNDIKIGLGLTFSTGQAQVMQWAYYELTWKENEATAQLAVIQKKNVY